MSAYENAQSNQRANRPSSAAGENPYALRQASYYALGILTLVCSFSFIDR